MCVYVAVSICVYVAALGNILNRSTNGMMPVRWTAPEGLNDLKFSSASDVWSFGITCIEIFQDAVVPYVEFTSNPAVMTMVNARQVHAQPTGCSDQSYAVIVECFRYEPEARPGFPRLQDLFTRMMAEPGTGTAERATPDELVSLATQDIQEAQSPAQLLMPNAAYVSQRPGMPGESDNAVSGWQGAPIASLSTTPAALGTSRLARAFVDPCYSTPDPHMLPETARGTTLTGKASAMQGDPRATGSARLASTHHRENARTDSTTVVPTTVMYGRPQLLTSDATAVPPARGQLPSQSLSASHDGRTIDWYRSAPGDDDVSSVRRASTTSTLSLVNVKAGLYAIKPSRYEAVGQPDPTSRFEARIFAWDTVDGGDLGVAPSVDELQTVGRGFPRRAVKITRDATPDRVVVVPTDQEGAHERAGQGVPHQQTHHQYAHVKFGANPRAGSGDSQRKGDENMYFDVEQQQPTRSEGASAFYAHANFGTTPRAGNDDSQCTGHENASFDVEQQQQPTTAEGASAFSSRVFDDPAAAECLGDGSAPCRMPSFAEVSNVDEELTNLRQVSNV